jgi:hypothetical protein
MCLWHSVLVYGTVVTGRAGVPYVTCRRAVTHSGVSGNIRVTDILLEKRVYVRGIGDTVWSLSCEKYSSHESYIRKESGN